MLSNIEFAHFYHVPPSLPPEIAEFALFDVDMGKILGDDKQPLYPHLVGKPLWKITPKNPEPEKKDDSREKKLRLYIERGWAFEKPS